MSTCVLSASKIATPILFKIDEGAPPEGTICNSTGWGVLKPGALTYPNALQLAQIPIHSKEICETMYPGYITYGMTCAGGPGTGPCNVRKIQFFLREINF